MIFIVVYFEVYEEHQYSSKEWMMTISAGILQISDVGSLKDTEKYKKKMCKLEEKYYSAEKEIDALKAKLKEVKKENSQLQNKFNWLKQRILGEKD